MGYFNVSGLDGQAMIFIRYFMVIKND